MQYNPGVIAYNVHRFYLHSKEKGLYKDEGQRDSFWESWVALCISELGLPKKINFWFKFKKYK